MVRAGMSALIAVAMAVLFSAFQARTSVVHADGANLGFCHVYASATASAYDGSSTGSSYGDISAADYALDSCVGLGQTNAIFESGLACENAGIPAAAGPDLGYAVVGWFALWSAGDTFTVAGPGAPQQYDCGDTFGH
jgi:hypothetical protein